MESRPYRLPVADSPDLVAYRNTRPGKRMGAGALIRDTQGRVLVVEPTYKDEWEVPGGAVEADESPREACRRELAEELGLDLPVGRMLVVEWQGPEPDRSESLMFLYDGGVLNTQVIAPASDELKSYAFVDATDLDRYLVERLSRCMKAALTALDEERLVEMEHGVIVPSPGQ